MKEALNKLSGRKPSYINTKTEMKFQIAKVCINGFERQPIKDIKEALFNLRFQLTKIQSIDFIGKKTIEFTINQSYIYQFINKIKDI